MMLRRYTSLNSLETAAIAVRVSSLLHRRDVILLKGDLGAGKSTFARALIKALCGEEIEVPSPTFTLVQTYEALLFTLWHFDLYRLKEPQEIYELGIEEAFRSGVSLIEWPERLGPLPQGNCLEIEFNYGHAEDERTLTFRGWDERDLKV